MKITKKEHKALLQLSFLEKAGDHLRDKVFALVDLAAAGTAYQKLMASTEKLPNGDKKFLDNDIEFTPAEIKVLKSNFDAEMHRMSSAQNAEFILELQALFNGKD